MPKLLALMMIAAAVSAWLLTPTPPRAAARSATLLQLIPRAFGEWREVATSPDAVDPRNERETGRSIDSPYDEVLMRSYANGHGDVVLLVLAYGRVQRQEVKVHRPELCYVAQGFDVVQHTSVQLPLYRMTVLGSRMTAESPGRSEVVSYWVRIGNRYGENAWRIRYYLFMEGFHGRIPDGVLVRVSQTVTAHAAAPERFPLQEQFLAELLRAAPLQARTLLVGSDLASSL